MKSGTRFKADRLMSHRHLRAERHTMSEKLRDTCPREAHAHWKAPAGRPGPVSWDLKAEEGGVSLKCFPSATDGWPIAGIGSTCQWTSSPLRPRRGAVPNRSSRQADLVNFNRVRHNKTPREKAKLPQRSKTHAYDAKFPSFVSESASR